MRLLYFSIGLAVFALLSACSCKAQRFEMELNSDWQFLQAGDTEWLPAKIPGCVHTDLLASNKIPDPSLKADRVGGKRCYKIDKRQLLFEI